MSFYGNVKHRPSAPLIFDKIYPNRVKMDEALETGNDGIFINRYVLINYGCQQDAETENINFIDRWEFNSNTTNIENNIENNIYNENKSIDLNKYHAEYDLTAWMKIFYNGKQQYIMVGRLKTEPPTMAVAIDAPKEIPHLDLYQSSDLQYIYHIPSNWDIILNETENNNIEYPYFNKNGFSQTISVHDKETNNEILLSELNSGKYYPSHQYIEVQLTKNTYIPNIYYIKLLDDENHYELATKSFEDYVTNENIETGTFYIKTWKTNENGFESEEQPDQKALTISLPGIGNAVADLYDVLYGQGINNEENENIRPYTAEELFNWQNISPYNNLTEEDKISMGWAMEEFKNYISELRFLSHGAAGSQEPSPGTALQSDWLLSDINAFGYIYHKPRLLWSNFQENSNENEVPPNPTYEYTKHTIEYIYDNINNNNITKVDLFGNPLLIETRTGEAQIGGEENGDS